MANQATIQLTKLGRVAYAASRGHKPAKISLRHISKHKSLIDRQDEVMQLCNDIETGLGQKQENLSIFQRLINWI